MSNYAYPSGGLPPQTQLLTSRAVFTTAYAVIPKGVMADNVTSSLPNWDKTRLWVLSRPLSGFAETFSQYLMEVAPGGGSTKPEPDKGVEAILFVLDGTFTLSIDNETHTMIAGSYAYIPPAASWSVLVNGAEPARFHWIRKRYVEAEGYDYPDAFVVNENDISERVTPDTDNRWTATVFIDASDMRHDMQVNIVSFQPGAVIPFAETHVMEHGLYVLEGKAVYRLNQDWVEVEAGDYIWMRAFCPQACYAGGPDRFRYLLYKDINRHAKLP
ncbi:bifunctional allantoicase/(S)-ureidoglycine aminohydrolase [Brucellaceae bacterium C25G]